MSAVPTCDSGPGGGMFWERFPAPFAGVDEAGRGCLAGPVVAGAVILPPRYDLPGLTDSKQVSPARRERLAQGIREQAVCWGLGLAWPREIDRINILQATLAAMCRAVRCLAVRPRFLAVDGLTPIPFDLPQQPVVRGDVLVPAISAASILAKTFRDRLLRHLDRRYPGYGFARHKGYGTREHLEAIRVLGASPMHRRSFRGAGGPDAGPSWERRLCLPGI